MKRLSVAVRDAVTGGRFLGVWSLLVTVPLSVTIMAPVGAGVDVAAVMPATFATTASFVAALSVVALLERRTRDPRARAVVIVVVIVVSAALRPVAQDAWAAVLALPSQAPAQLPFRMATNIIVWPVVLAVVAVLENTLRSLKRTNALLRDVAQELSGARARAVGADRVARAAVRDAASALASAVARLTGESGIPAVRELGAGAFRTESHRLQTLADDPMIGVGAGNATAPSPLARRRPALPPLRVPPRGTVTLVYIACTLPFALRTSSTPVLMIGLAAVLIVGAVVDAAARTRRAATRPRTTIVVFLTAAACGGALLSLVAVAGGYGGFIAVLPMIDYLAFSLAGALCSGVLHALRREQRRLSGAVSHAQQAARDGTRTAREGLRRTAELLHRDGQGDCVRFALEHAEPSRDDVIELRRRLDDVVARMPSTYEAVVGGADAAALTSLIETWARVMDLHTTVSPAASDAMDRHPWAARDAYDVVAEGLLNAVKHGGGDRYADIRVDLAATGAGPRLRVQVRTRHPLPAGVELRPASGVRELGARLHPDGAGAVLEASFSLAPAPAVVSAEHPGDRAAPGS